MKESINGEDKNNKSVDSSNRIDNSDEILRALRVLLSTTVVARTIVTHDNDENDNNNASISINDLNSKDGSFIGRVNKNCDLYLHDNETKIVGNISISYSTSAGLITTI